jgi:hypothetical protein
MTATRTPSKNLDVPPQAIVRELLARPEVITPALELTPARARRVATLEKKAPIIVNQARDAGAEIEYLGINPLFAEARLYQGIDTDWVLAPATKRDDAVVPRRARQALQRLSKAELEFPLIYVAHEVEKEKTKELVSANGKSHVVLEHEKAAELVGRIPARPPVRSSSATGSLTARRRCSELSAESRRSQARWRHDRVWEGAGVRHSPILDVHRRFGGIRIFDADIGGVPVPDRERLFWKLW